MEWGDMIELNMIDKYQIIGAIPFSNIWKWAFGKLVNYVATVPFNSLERMILSSVEEWSFSSKILLVTC